MRALVVHPGAAYSTADVYDGVVAGLRANGVTVLEGRLDTIAAWYAATIGESIQRGVLAADALMLDGRLNRSAVISAHVTRYALLTRPDWLIVVSGHNYNAHDARALSRAGIRTAVLLTEAPYWADEEREIASFYDVAFTNERRSAARLGAHYLPHAYHPTRHTPDGPRADPCDVVFVGSMFDERRALFDGVDWTDIRLVLRGELLPQRDIVPNHDTAAHYRSAAICLNHHRTTTQHGSGQHIAAGSAESLGPRAYEIPACGGFMLCDDSRPELDEVFGDTVPTYRAGDAADLEQQIRHYLRRPDERARLGAAQYQAVRGRDWTARARRLLEVLG